MQAQDGLPAEHQCLVHNGRIMADSSSLAACGLEAGSTVHQSSRLLGGKPVKVRANASASAVCPWPRASLPCQPCTALACPDLQVKLLTNHLPCGQEVTVDLEPSASKDDIKAKLEAATGVPREHQKLLLSGINQIVMGDKRWGQEVGARGGARGGGWVWEAGHRQHPYHAAIISCGMLSTAKNRCPNHARRTNIGFSACGSTNGVQMAVNSK